MFRVTSSTGNFESKLSYGPDIPITDEEVHVQAQSIEVLDKPTVKGVLFGTECTKAHIVPLQVLPSDSDNMTPDIYDVIVSRWVDIVGKNPAYFVPRDHCYDRYTNFPDDDGIPSNIHYLVYFETQPIGKLRFKRWIRNQYVSRLRGGLGPTWYANLVVCKSDSSNQIYDMTLDDIDIAKRCVAITTQLKRRVFVRQKKKRITPVFF